MQPLRVMTGAMQDIAEGEGDLTKRLTIQTQDEFGILGMASTACSGARNAGLRRGRHAAWGPEAAGGAAAGP